jgi:hypothetical protein
MTKKADDTEDWYDLRKHAAKNQSRLRHEGLP